jgi:cytochrome c oxidase subunit 2
MNLSYIYGNISEPWQILFQDSGTKIMEGIINLHNWILFYLIIISIFVLWFLIVTINEFNVHKNPISYRKLKDGTLIEVIWTITPALILITIALPSFKLLYLMDEILDPTITIKAIGRQWYWEYEYSDYISPELSFESYMIPTDNLEEGQLRLLEVDNRLILPSDTSIRVIVTAADVLHSWTVPSLGVKMDCVPGRLNQTSIYVKRNGVYYGQCSELCGVQHGFMPIVIEVVNINDYINWLKAYEVA